MSWPIEPPVDGRGGSNNVLPCRRRCVEVRTRNDNDDDNDDGERAMQKTNVTPKLREIDGEISLAQPQRPPPPAPTTKTTHSFPKPSILKGAIASRTSEPHGQGQTPKARLAAPPPQPHKSIRIRASPCALHSSPFSTHPKREMLLVPARFFLAGDHVRRGRFRKREEGRWI